MLLASWTPAAASAAARNERAVHALLDLESDVIAAQGIPSEKTQALAAVEAGRLNLLGDRPRIVTALERLKEIDALPWADDQLFFCVETSEAKAKEISSVLGSWTSSRGACRTGRSWSPCRSSSGRTSSSSARS